MPKIFKSSFDIRYVLIETKLITNRNENFVRYYNKEKCIIIFFCKINFEAMCKAEIVYMD